MEEEEDYELKLALEMSKQEAQQQEQTQQEKNNKEGKKEKGEDGGGEGEKKDKATVEWSKITQYDESVDNGKSCCTFVASLVSLMFLNDIPFVWEEVIRQAATLYNSYNTDRMLRGISDASSHCTLEESFQFLFSSPLALTSSSSFPSAPSSSSFFQKMPHIQGFGDDLFGVLLRSSPPPILPPKPSSHIPLVKDLLEYFDDLTVPTLSHTLKKHNNDYSQTLHFLLENHALVLLEQKREEAQLAMLYHPYASVDISPPASSLSTQKQLRNLEDEENLSYECLKRRVNEEKELVAVHACGYEVVNGRKGLGSFILSELERLKKKKNEKKCLVFTAQMQTTCLLIDSSGSCQFRDSHKNDQMFFSCVKDFFGWLETSDLFVPMHDTNADGFLDFGMIHFNKVDVYHITVDS